MNIRPILNLDEVPDKDNELFWNNVDNPDQKGFVLFLIMNTIRSAGGNNIYNLTGDQAKNMLFKLVAFQEIIDGSSSIVNTITDNEDE